MSGKPIDQTDELRSEEAIQAFIGAAAETGDLVYQADCELIAERARKRWGLLRSQVAPSHPRR
jgi:hypothetical protein